MERERPRGDGREDRGDFLSLSLSLTRSEMDCFFRIAKRSCVPLLRSLGVVAGRVLMSLCTREKSSVFAGARRNITRFVLPPLMMMAQTFFPPLAPACLELVITVSARARGRGRREREGEGAGRL